MVKKIFLFLVLISTLNAFSQDTIFVSKKAKTYVIFDEEISFADFETELFYGNYAQNTVMLQAKEDSSLMNTSNIIIKHGNNIFKGILFIKNVLKPSEYFYDYRKEIIEEKKKKEDIIPVVELERGEISTISETAFEDKVLLNDEISLKMKTVLSLKQEEKLLGDFSSDHLVSIDVIRNDSKVTYLKIRFENRSSAKYIIDKVDFDFKEKGKSNSTLDIQNFNMKCIAYNNVKFIEGNSTEYLVYAIPIFSTSKGELHVLIRQLNGTRSIDISIPVKELHTAKYIN